MMMVDVADVRRKNLQELVQTRFHGIRAGLAKAAGKNRNQINLCLTPNEKLRRRMGEDQARDIEAALNLPMGWLDEDHGKAAGLVTQVARYAKQKQMDVDMFPDGLQIGTKWLEHLCAGSAVDNLRIFHVQELGLAGTISTGDVVLVDLAVKRVDRSGYYLLHGATGDVVRRVWVGLDGQFSMSLDANEEGHLVTMKPDQLQVRGRVRGRLSASML
jgi:hypothetical protein